MLAVCAHANDVAAVSHLHVKKILASRVGDRTWVLWYWLSSTGGRAVASAHVRCEGLPLLLIRHIVCVGGRWRAMLELWKVHQRHVGGEAGAVKLRSQVSEHNDYEVVREPKKIKLGR